MLWGTNIYKMAKNTIESIVFTPLSINFELLMIALLKGHFLELTPAKLIVDVGGVGYEVNISLHTYSAIAGKEQGALYTYLHITENAQVLFGFAALQEKELFLHLISVSGVGASTARMMLSGMQPDEIIKAIVQGDARQLEQIKGIGKKSAERLVLELKDKLSKSNTISNTSIQTIGTTNTKQQDAIQALVALGIQKATAEKAVEKTMQLEGNELNIAQLIKLALKNC